MLPAAASEPLAAAQGWLNELDPATPISTGTASPDLNSGVRLGADAAREYRSLSGFRFTRISGMTYCSGAGKNHL